MKARPMAHRGLARFIAAVHVAYVAFVVLGSLLVLRWHSLMWIHIAAVAWAFATLGFDLGCPLTPWEKAQWRLGGLEPYPEGFLQHHVLRTRFAEENSRRTHTWIGVTVLLVNAVIYSVILFS